MNVNVKQFHLREGTKVRLKDWPTRVDPLYASKDDYEKQLAEHVERLSEQQARLYAVNRYAVLLVFQGTDASGKDGAIKHVMSGVNPEGCEVYSFKKPNTEELQHDFLWRTTVRLPERGRLGIFNRSYYEEVLVARVHPEIIEAQHLPEPHKNIWKRRYHSILDLERHLHWNGTRIVKFFLHLSKEEQRRRLLERIDDSSKNWKFSQADIQERALWNEYTSAYEKCLTHTSTDHAPWYIIPADDKKDARLIISQVVLNALEDLKMHYPKTSNAQIKELKKLRKRLVK